MSNLFGDRIPRLPSIPEPTPAAYLDRLQASSAAVLSSRIVRVCVTDYERRETVVPPSGTPTPRRLHAEVVYEKFAAAAGFREGFQT
jgi:hypothetical protein